MYYILLILAVILGQTFVAAVASWVYQRKNENIGYGKALNLYLAKEIGTFAVILSFTGIILFILSDWMDMTATKEILRSKEKLTRFEQAQSVFRTVAVVYGVFAQWIALLFFKAGKKAIETYGTKQGVDVNDNKTI